MSDERLVIVYVGSSESAKWLADNLGPDTVYHAEALLPALGMIVTYMPTAIVLDATSAPELARETYYHLRTVDAEPIFILDDGNNDWDFRVRVVSTQADLLDEIHRLTLDTVGA